jgi:deazaflavin-dependent oxidoreductase (nitroreductase family)
VAEEQDWNAKIIEEFRANEGRVGGPFEGFPLLLLHTTGAKSGQERVNPLAYQIDGDRFMVFASKAGAPTNPDWYYNVIANPDVTFEMGTQTRRARATVLTGEERDRIWKQQVLNAPTFGEYEKTAGRVIPVVMLEPTD